MPPDSLQSYEPRPREIVEEKMKTYVEDFHRGYKARLLREAALARDEAISYRAEPFKVGCGIQAKHLTDRPGEYGVYTGYNNTPTRAKRVGVEKRCAERNAIDSALETGPSLIVAIVTVSKELTTDVNNPSIHDALHPCYDCRELLRDLLHQGILRSDSVVLSVNDDPKLEGGITRMEEERTIEQLLQLYQDDEKRVLN